MKKRALLLALVLLLVFVGVAAADSAERLGYPPYDSEITLDPGTPLLDSTDRLILPLMPPTDDGQPVQVCKIIEGPVFSFKICYPH